MLSAKNVDGAPLLACRWEIPAQCQGVSELPKRNILQQIARELMEANRSATFWRSQMPLFNEEPLKSAVEACLARAEATVTELQTAREEIDHA